MPTKVDSLYGEVECLKGEYNYLREVPKNMFIFFLLMEIMYMENGDQVSKRGMSPRF